MFFFHSNPLKISLQVRQLISSRINFLSIFKWKTVSPTFRIRHRLLKNTQNYLKILKITQNYSKLLKIVSPINLKRTIASCCSIVASNNCSLPTVAYSVFMFRFEFISLVLKITYCALFAMINLSRPTEFLLPSLIFDMFVSNLCRSSNSGFFRFTLWRNSVIP